MTPETLLSILKLTPGWAEQAEAVELDDTATLQVLSEARKLAENTLAPLATRADAEGCKVENGRVKAPSGYRETFRQMGVDGWIASDLDPEFGGMGLPLALYTAASVALEGAAQPFMMMVGSATAASHCIAATNPELAAEWCPKLTAGEWSATICISEPDAGSDVGRIRTKAVQEGPSWRILGTKCWISFGDHDASDRIGHLCLARTGTPEDGTRGLSLFLVPNHIDGQDNGIFVERIEEKLGLHGSPTCVLRFEGAAAQMLGDPGRGLPALFNMIELMRLQVGTQGAGVATACAALASAYAEDRKQGGHPAKPPVPIISHPDVERQLLVMDARAKLAVALALENAVVLGQAHAGDAEAARLATFLLPLAKTFGGEMGQQNADAAIQVLGGAGYTREWPAERYFRDARIFTIYEGTTGMQAQDILFRRLLKDEGTLDLLRARLGGARSNALIDRVTEMVETLRSLSPRAQMLAADGMLRACWYATSAGLAERLRGHLDGDAGLDVWLSTGEAQMATVEATIHWAAQA